MRHEEYRPRIAYRDLAVAPLTILYNGACPLCRTGIESYAKADRRGACRHNWIDITTHPEALSSRGLLLDDVKKRLHVEDGSGRLHIGVDAAAALWQHSPGQGWLATMARLPGLHTVLAFLYDRILAPLLFAWNQAKGR